MTIKQAGESNITDIDKNIIRRPYSIFPWSNNPENIGSNREKNNGTVWIHMKAYKIIDQFSKAQGQVTRIGTPEVQYAFLAPTNIGENIVHHWEAYESIASRLAQKVRSAARVGAEVGALTTGFGNANLYDAFKDIYSRSKENPAQSIANVTKAGYNLVGSAPIPKFKVDTPLYYENSDRRQIVFSFLLVAEKDPKADVMDVIHNLQKKSSPELEGPKGASINIQFPYMWEVYSYPNKGFINYSTCALTGVQPTYNAPYIDGYPSWVQLEMTFIDLGPLYRSSIDEGTSIRVINTSTTRARRNSGDAPITKTNSLGVMGGRSQGLGR